MTRPKAPQIYSAIQTGGRLGMQTMEQALSNLVKTGVISVDEGMAKSSKPDEFKRLLGGTMNADMGNGNVVAQKKRR